MKKLNMLIGFLCIVVVVVSVNVLLVSSNNRFLERNMQRKQDVSAIFSAIRASLLENNSILQKISLANSCSGSKLYEICKTGAKTCENLVDLSYLTDSGRFLIAIPTDPTGISENGVGYHAVKDKNNKVTVCAPDAEKITIMLQDK